MIESLLIFNQPSGLRHRSSEQALPFGRLKIDTDFKISQRDGEIRQLWVTTGTCIAGMNETWVRVLTTEIKTIYAATFPEGSPPKIAHPDFKDPASFR